MATIGAWNIELARNGSYAATIQTNLAASSLTGWSARLDVRHGRSETSTLALSLTSTPAAGLTLSIVSSTLAIAVAMTEAQVDALCAAIDASLVPPLYHSLKLTMPDSATLPLLHGTVSYAWSVVP